MIGTHLLARHWTRGVRGALRGGPRCGESGSQALDDPKMTPRRPTSNLSFRLIIAYSVYWPATLSDPSRCRVTGVVQKPCKSRASKAEHVNQQ